MGKPKRPNTSALTHWGLVTVERHGALSTLVQKTATSHFLNQCWPQSMSPFGAPRPQWVESLALTPYLSSYPGYFWICNGVPGDILGNSTCVYPIKWPSNLWQIYMLEQKCVIANMNSTSLINTKQWNGVTIKSPRTMFISLVQNSLYINVWIYMYSLNNIQNNRVNPLTPTKEKTSKIILENFLHIGSQLDIFHSHTHA